MKPPVGALWAPVFLALAVGSAGCFPGRAEATVGAYDHPAIGDSLVYVSGNDGYLYALDKDFLGQRPDQRKGRDSSDQSWTVAVGQEEDPPPLVAGPALDRDRNIVLVGSEDGNLYVFDAALGGEELWRFPTGEKIWSTPVIKDGVVYFGSHDKNVYAVNLETQKEKWRFATGGAVAGRPLLFRDLVVVGSFDKKLYGIDASTGRKRWELQGDNWFWAGAVADQRTIFAPSMDGNIYAVDVEGNLLWKHALSSAIVSRPALVPGGLVVAARKGGVISLLDTNPVPKGNDRLIDSEFVGDAEIKAPLYAEGDRVYVGTEGSTVIRLDLETGRAGRLVLDEAWCFDTSNDREC